MALQMSAVQSVEECETAAWLFVCRTCVRDAPIAPNEASKGSIMASRLRTLLREAGLDRRVQMRVVSCLNGCVNPCNIAFRGKEKYSFRFGGLEPDDAAAAIAFAKAYSNHRQGHVPPEEWHEPLRAKLSSKIAPPGLAPSNQTKP